LSLNPKLLSFIYRTEKLLGFLNSSRKSIKELPGPVSEQTVKKFFSNREIQKENENLGEKVGNFKIGELVKINEGPFLGYEGKIISFDEKKTKVKIEIDFLGQFSSLELPINSCVRPF
jgi:transcriptional antiterminator NusG